MIQLLDVHKRYADTGEALRAVNLEIGAGEFVFLTGHSGAGKSTLLRCANLLEIPQQGEIFFQGIPIAFDGEGQHRRPAKAAQVRTLRTHLSMVFQQFNLWGHMTILDNVIEAPVTVLKRDKTDTIEKAHALLAKVGIGDKWRFYPSQLSGGQQQRAVVCGVQCRYQHR